MAATEGGVPVADNLFRFDPDGPVLIGGRSKRTGEIRFPFTGSADEEPVDLARTGTLWSWTVQRFLPKQPPYRGRETKESFQPYALGYVELPGQVRVESRLVGCAPDALQIGMALELTIVPMFADDAGRDVLGFAFRPVAGGQ
ncbi:MAG TPA: OB-fold domain-containing protein [Stellaceae bacterium]|nr:OB-fold domain-containing protein [Stellaceae bacterium]